MAQSSKIEDSEFYMWRALFAFTLVDHVLSLEEQSMLKIYLAKIPFSKEQLLILRDSLHNPPDVVDMYQKITNPKDKERFCVLARALVWCEGNMDKQEEEILKRVSCLKTKEGKETLFKTRSHPEINNYHEYYAKAGMQGMLKRAAEFEMRI